MTTSSTVRDSQDFDFHRARASLTKTLARYTQPPRSRPTDRNTQLERYFHDRRDVVRANLDKLDRQILRIAAFGAVSRGKSAVLNALLGQNLLPTGPLNGVTQWPRSVLWLSPTDRRSSDLQVELIDTPGLDEIDGGTRSDLAREVARQADAILFVVAGDVTRTEYAALCDLWQTRKPALLVFNKTDLYPNCDREAVYEQLRSLGNRQGVPLRPDEIVRVAADPKPLRVRHERPDGRVEEVWETPPPDVKELKEKLLTLLAREGRSLLALNALVQARDAELEMVKTLVELRDRDADELIWKFTRYKAAAVALNPVFVLDVLGGSLADLILVRSLAHLYDLPMTNYEAGKLLKTILLGAGGLLLGETLSNAAFGLGKSVGFAGYAGSAVAQAAIAGVGTHTVGQAAKTYLERGGTWGPAGADTVIREILDRVDRDSLLARLRL
ncbi:GTPase [Leptolyngbya valderiana BDU 20041]|nr:GTPase [Leptolyngbya valderiana BDU 20041]